MDLVFGDFNFSPFITCVSVGWWRGTLDWHCLGGLSLKLSRGLSELSRVDKERRQRLHANLGKPHIDHRSGSAHPRFPVAFPLTHALLLFVLSSQASSALWSPPVPRNRVLAQFLRTPLPCMRQRIEVPCPLLRYSLRTIEP